MKKLGKILVTLITIMALLITPTIAYASDTTSDASDSGVVYLSDLDRVSTSIGYGQIGIDQNSNGNQISVYVNGRRKYFDKGIFAHAKSTLVYDLTNYNNEYDYFITYLGVDASQGSAGSVYFQIYVSNDGVNWGDPVLTTDVLTASSESVYYELSLEGVNYIKLYADPNGGNGNDHAVYADAKLVNYESYFDASITKAEDYNADIETLYEKY
ncbi:MAG: NPCBM/NEW2 domain-containing protein [Prevotella sp.]|nr:NPCBM/NEW2 domain-containing protein [Prevotella sp.]